MAMKIENKEKFKEFIATYGKELLEDNGYENPEKQAKNLSKETLSLDSTQEQQETDKKTGISDTFYKNNVLRLLKELKAAEDEGLLNQKYLESHLLDQENKIKNKLDEIISPLQTIKKCIIFFTVIAVIGIVVGILAAIIPPGTLSL